MLSVHETELVPMLVLVREDRGEYVGELERLAQLRDQGIITNEDFEAKKKQLLGI